jgi:hypothetical protein
MIAINEDAVYIYTVRDFASDEEQGSLDAIELVLLTGQGTTFVQADDGSDPRPFVAGERVPIVDIRAGRLTFVPDADTSGPSYAGLEFRLVVLSAGGVETVSKTRTTSVEVLAVNDAPTVSGPAAVEISGILEDRPPADGYLVRDLVTGSFADMDGDALAGIAVTAITAGGAAGVWQYLDGSGWTLITPTAEGAVLLSADARVRFLPDTDANGDAPKMEARLVDGSAGPIENGSFVDLASSGTGGATPYSAASVAFGQRISQVNDAPRVSGLEGDGVAVLEGGAPVRLDAGLDFRIVDGDNNGFVVERAGGGYGTPLFVAPVPDGSGRVFVLAKLGQIHIFDPGTGEKSLFLDIQSSIDFQSEQGLLGFATAPDFATSGAFYVYATNRQGDNQVLRFSVTEGDRDVADPTSADVVLDIPFPGSTAHNGGWIGFGPDGLLYIATGDGSDGGDAFRTAQDPNSLRGKLLRIDVSTDGFADDPNRDYALPANNPFSAGGGAPEIWALGLRNPFRNSFDAETGRLYIGDVGQALVEEINVLEPGLAGANFGWSIVEGTRPYIGGDTAGLIAPVIEYGHGRGPNTGNSVTGGYVYRGPVEALQGQYFFGDFITTNIWGVDAAALNVGATISTVGITNYKTAFLPATGGIGLISSFGVDEAGNLYINDFSDGEVYRVVASAGTNFAAGSLRVAINDRIIGEDQLRVDASAASGVSLSAGQTVESVVRVDGVLIGRIAAAGTGLGGEDLVVSFASGATPARVSTFLRALQYNNSNDVDPVPGARTVTYTITDGAGSANGGADATTFSSNVYVVALNDAPEGTDGSVVLSRGSGYVFSVDDFGFRDSDGNSFAGVVVATVQAGGSLTLNGREVVAGQFVAAGAIAAGELNFAPDAGGAGSGYARLTFQVRDSGSSGGGNENTDRSAATFTIDMVAANENPTLSLSLPGQGDYLSYVEGGVPLLIAPGGSVTDADSLDFAGGSMRVSISPTAAGTLSVRDQGVGIGQVGVSGSTVTFGGAVIASLTSDGQGGLVFDLTENAGAESLTGLLRNIAYENGSDTPPASVSLDVTISDGDGGQAQAAASIAIAAVDDGPVARDDAFTTDEDVDVSGDLTGDNGAGADVDVDGPALSVVAVNGAPVTTGAPIMLASGALLTVEANGSFRYDPSGAFDYLPGGASGASNAFARDIFDYTLGGGATASVAVTIRGKASDADMLLGTAGSDQIRGGAGADRFLGLGGGDFLYGGGGDDLYIVYAGDRVFEAAGEGFDTIGAFGSYQLRLGAQIEVLATTNEAGEGAVTLIGNELGQTIYGNAGANRLIGLGGADTLAGSLGNDSYVVDSADDVVIEGEGGGFDTVSVQSSYTLGFNAEVELFATAQEAGASDFTLTGNRFAQSIYGNAGANRLAGGGGADALIGLSGNDFYVVDADDRVLEASGGGYDTVVAGQDHALTPEAEIELFATERENGTDPRMLIGNRFAQFIYGNAGANTIDGKGGADTLIGLGDDDRFLFSTALGADNVDRIFNFAPGSDRIGLSSAIFGGAAAGSLVPGAFAVGSRAGDADDRIIYNRGTGALLYDADGAGGQDAVQFASLAGGLSITAADFFVF